MVFYVHDSLPTFTSDGLGSVRTNSGGGFGAGYWCGKRLDEKYVFHGIDLFLRVFKQYNPCDIAC